jgi:hypothetical protein
MAEQDDDVALIRRWFQKLQICIQTVDFVGSRPLFADDLITFGTLAAFTVGREATEKEQWRKVWGQIDQFRWRLDDLRTITSGDRLTAVGMAVFEPPATLRTAGLSNALDEPQWRWGGELSARSGSPSTLTCLCSLAPPHAPSAPSGSIRLLFSGTDTASRESWAGDPAAGPEAGTGSFAGVDAAF